MGYFKMLITSWSVSLEAFKVYYVMRASAPSLHRESVVLVHHLVVQSYRFLLVWLHPLILLYLHQANNFSLFLTSLGSRVLFNSLKCCHPKRFPEDDCFSHGAVYSGRSNVVYRLSMALGTKREDQTDSLLPSKRMPMGLIEH